MTEAAVPQPHDPARLLLLRRGLLLVTASVTWMLIEGAVALTSGVAAGSVALLAFGVDSLIELASDLVVAWRLRTEQTNTCPARIAKVERDASRMAGAILWLLAAYIGIDAGRRLLGFGDRAEESVQHESREGGRR